MVGAFRTLKAVDASVALADLISARQAHRVVAGVALVQVVPPGAVAGLILAGVT